MSEIQADKDRRNDLKAKIEALLFVSASPISVNQLGSYLDEKPRMIEMALNELSEEYKLGRGLRLEEYHGRFQLTSAPEFYSIIEQYLGHEESSSLSQAALEALSIVAYRQPVTRPDIDEVRGVNSDGVVRNLLNKGLIQEIGRSEGAGRPILYGTTNDFLQYFGLSALKELPQFEEIQEEKITGNGKILKD
jgi:segregation and condensation protein B